MSEKTNSSEWVWYKRLHTSGGGAFRKRDVVCIEKYPKGAVEHIAVFLSSGSELDLGHDTYNLTEVVAFMKELTNE